MPSEILTSDLLAELTKHKAEILTFLRKAGDTRSFTYSPIGPISRTAQVHISVAQHGLWLIDRLFPNKSAYNSERALRLQGALNVAALEESLNEIVRRHETLRTSFPSVEGQPFQVITPASKSNLSIIDLRHRTETKDRQTEAERIRAEEAESPFDLEKGPLFRSKLICLSD